MSKVNISDLFAKAKSVSAESVGSSEPETATTALPANQLFPIPSEEHVKFDIDFHTDTELPDFFSESSTISLLPRGGASGGRLVAAGGQYLCLARGEALWVLDMTTGMSNDRSVRANTKAITDMEFSASASLLVFTDGTDVGVLKCVGINGSSVQLNGATYLRNVGSQEDPVVAVRWHPTHGPGFVTVRANTGWTLWDLVRLNSKASPVAQDTEGIPGLFRQCIEEPHNVSEGTYRWSSAAVMIGGKQLSPGVLAILRRGQDSPKRATSPTGGNGVFSGFSFAANGAIALASVGDAVKCWSIGRQCSTVSHNKACEESISGLLGGKAVKTIVGYEGTCGHVGLVSECEIRIVSIEENGAKLVKRISFAGAELTAATRFAFTAPQTGERQNATVLSGLRDKSSSFLAIIVGQSIVAIAGQQERIETLVAVPTVGNARQIAIYANGNSGGNIMWTAQTIDMDLEAVSGSHRSPVLNVASDAVEASPLVGFYENGGETSPMNEEDDFPRSETLSASAPERLESTVEFNNRDEDRWSESAKEQLLAEISQTVQTTVERRLESFLRERTAELTKSAQQQIEKEARRLEQTVAENIRKVVKDQFGAAMKRAIAEIGSQIEHKVAQRFEAITDFVEKDGNDSVKRLDELIARVDAAIERAKAQGSASSAIPSMGPAEPPALSEIRQFINAGDHVQAIATAAQWWKLNSGTNPQNDLLAIACAAIAPQLRSGEPLRDVVTGCYMLLVLTEWTKSNAALHADRTVAVLRAARFVTACLFASPLNLAGESQELCHKSLSKSVRNAAAVLGTGDRTVDDLSRDVLSEVRELMMRFAMSSRESTPRSSVAGSSILHLLQSGSRKRHF